MVSEVEDLGVEYEEDGVLIIKQIDKEILSKGAWATVIFRYKEWNRSIEGYGEDKYGIRRYQKRNGEYQLKSKFNISSKDQALKIISALQKWTADAQDNPEGPAISEDSDSG